MSQWLCIEAPPAYQIAPYVIGHDPLFVFLFVHLFTFVFSVGMMKLECPITSGYEIRKHRSVVLQVAGHAAKEFGYYNTHY